MNKIVTGIRLALWDQYRCARKQIWEFLVYAILHVLAGGTYYYGMFYLLEEVHGDSSGMVRLVHIVLATWIFIGFLANMQLIQIRNSSIKNRILIPPTPEKEVTGGFHTSDNDGMMKNISQDDSCSYNRGKGGTNNHLTNDLKHLAQQFTNRPYNSDTAWHICASCETYVPPRSWHCQTCETCVLRRDHHCLFVMKCIGEDNQSHFLGLLFYMAAGTAYFSVLSFIHGVYFLEIPYWMWVFKTLVAFYTIIFDFSFYNIIISVNFTGCITATSIFGYYLWLALKGQTSADETRKISRTPPNGAKYSYSNLEGFLGPNPILRILWPFHQVVLNNYSSQKGGGGLGSTPKDL